MTLEGTDALTTKGAHEDEVLVRECLKGNKAAWSALIDKYRSLVFSIPMKRGFSREDANEIFQSVWLTLLNEISNLREPRALAAWLIRATSHQCLGLIRKQRPFVEELGEDEQSEDPDRLPDVLLQELEREQLLREVIREQSPDCQRLIKLLFFEDPPIPYVEAARHLGLATGSIGATRGRCLEKLRQALDRRNFS
ncbi:MAG: RNA polymerase sigma factor [Bryobacteraceae bacterium]